MILPKNERPLSVGLLRIISVVVTVYSCSLIYWMFIGFGRSDHHSNEYRYNLIPFETIRRYIKYYDHFNNLTWVINLFGNVGVFIPFGMLLPLIIVRFRSLPKLLLGTLIVLIMLEFLQMILRVGSFDVDDILLNMIGVSVGFVFYLKLK